MAPSLTLSALLCNQIRPGLRKIRFKSRRKPSPSPCQTQTQTTPFPVVPAGLGKSIFDHFLVLFVPCASCIIFTAKDRSTRLATRRGYLFYPPFKPRCASPDGRSWQVCVPIERTSPPIRDCAPHTPTPTSHEPPVSTGASSSLSLATKKMVKIEGRRLSQGISTANHRFGL
jgi:hypothetical protein